MKLSEIKSILNNIEKVEFALPNGEVIPNHFHITEVGQVEKHFIDCGGSVRKESVINFQLWTAEDYDHRLSAEKLKKIIALSERKLMLADSEIEVEYQSDTIGKYHVNYDGNKFVLSNTHTDCLAKESCGIPQDDNKVKVSANSSDQCCAPGSGCC